MINLEYIDTKENLIQDFYRWLFDDNNVFDKSVILEKEVDISLAPYYTDPYIYYPKQIANFFNTKAMQRLGRVSQLALANDIYPNIYHNRLEHSKGVYNRKLEEFLYHFQDFDLICQEFFHQEAPKCLICNILKAFLSIHLLHL